MKAKICILLLITITAIGQPKAAFWRAVEPCNCLHKSFESDSSSFALYDNNQAQKQVNEYLGLLHKYLPENVKSIVPRIITRHEDCIGKRIALATKCPNDNTKYIYYNRNIFEKIDLESKMAINFILAHEVGHHIFNHFHNNTSAILNNDVSKTYVERTMPCKTKYCNEVRNKHLQELEADFIAVWILKKMKVDRDDFNELFDVIKTKGELTETGISSTHPSIVIRKQHAQKAYAFLDNIKQNDLLIKGRGFTDGEYDEILYNLDKNEIQDLNEYEKKMIDLHKLSVEAIHLKFLGDSLVKSGDYGAAVQTLSESLNKLKQSYYYSEKDSLIVASSIESCKRILNKKYLFTISPYLSIGYPINSIQVNNEKLLTANNQIGSTGIRFGLLNWSSKSWIESELGYSLTKFNVLGFQNGTNKIVESFILSSLNLNLSYAFNTLGRKKEILNWGKGVTIVAGPKINYYLPSTYKNYYSNFEQKGRYLKSSLGPHLELGLESASHKRNLPFKNYRISAIYDLQKMNFFSSSLIKENTKLLNHSISLKLSYRQW